MRLRRQPAVRIIIFCGCVAILALLAWFASIPSESRIQPASVSMESAGEGSPPLPSHPYTTTAEPGSDTRREERLRMINPDLSGEETLALMEESDRFRVALDREGIVDADLTLRHEINNTEVSDDELRDYFEANRDHFGNRSFEESRGSLESLVRLRKVREKYGSERDFGEPTD